MTPPEDTTTRAENAPARAADERRHEPTGLPWLRTWPSVYLFALVCFVIYVVLLAVFSRTFS